jgi:hypothetical protein
MYSDEQLDVGVVYVGGGYRVTWGDYGSSYWYVPETRLVWSPRFIINWEQQKTVNRLELSELPEKTRSGPYLEAAYNRIAGLLGDGIISQIPIIPQGGTTAVDTYIVCVGGETGMSPDLDLAKWIAVGSWGQQNIKDVNDPVYLKLQNDSVFLIDENTFLIL